MTTYLRSLFEGSSYTRNGCPHSIATPSTSTPSKRSKSRPVSVSYSSFRPLDHSHPSVVDNTKEHHHHHHHRPSTPYSILLPSVSQHSHSSSTDSLPRPSPSSHKPTPRTANSEPRPVLKKRSIWPAKPHTGPQHHVSFANPNRPDVLHMHPLLASSRLNRAPISYDVTFPPSSTSLVDRRTRTAIPTHTLSQPATDPAKSIKLVLRCDRFPWPVIVYPQRPASITNLDLLHAVYNMLSTRVTHEEWESLGHGTHAQLKATKAYEVRCAKLGGGWEDGVRRIDWLGEKTCLVGVEVDKSASECGVAKLVFAKP
ncbi:hypothetical protein IW261DRAFT_1507275 [Armillaria novae-zelandiae]|uniref:DUF6699 domain-containing protein n=1 Tax=Armillaria novae-zelandiae TaxID=153914 RepID=A0AA39NVU9_9AGAR|nr:hypothetical protein IW261DRAFT_1507275 [Armillaria novae-zelandiae]